MKYSPSGQELWVRRYDGPDHGHDLAKVLVIDNQGNIVVTGISQGDYTTLKYNPQGQQLEVQRYEGTAQDVADIAVITVDSQSNVLVAGSSHENGNADYATGKYAASGGRLWLQYYHGIGSGNDGAKPWQPIGKATATWPEPARGMALPQTT